MSDAPTNGRIILCCGMPRAASTLQYQLATHIAGLAGPTTAMGWYDGTPLPDVVRSVPTGETWVFKVHGHSERYRFEQATTAGDVIGLSTSRDLRKVIESYRQLHSKSMWWVTRHRVLEGIISDHRRWSECDSVLMQRYADITHRTPQAAAAIAVHIGVEISPEQARDAAAEFDRNAQISRSDGRPRDESGVNNPRDLLQTGHVSPTERTGSASGLDTAWVESVGGRWLRANGFELRTSGIRRLLARLRHSPRLLWFLHFQITHRSLGRSAMARLRGCRSWARWAASRTRLVPFLIRREAARLVARTRIRTVSKGVTTVVIVSWNSEEILPDTLRLVARNSPPGTRIIVVDNGSGDATCKIAEADPSVELIRLRRNIGHGPAMDLGFLAASTEYCVALDADAFPIRDDWIETMRAELDKGFTVTGAHWRRHVGFYVHPSCLMMRRKRFVVKRHTFENRFLPGINPNGQMGTTYWDTGERISMREGAVNLSTFPMTSSLRHTVGMIFGDFVYHNGSTTRAADSREWVDSDGVEGAVDVWRHAVETHEHIA